MILSIKRNHRSDWSDLKFLDTKGNRILARFAKKVKALGFCKFLFIHIPIKDKIFLKSMV